MIDRILKGGSYFFSLFFVASFVIMQSGGCEFPNSHTPELTKEVLTISTPLDDKTEDKTKEETSTTGNSETGKAVTGETGDETGKETGKETDCVCTK